MIARIIAAALIAAAGPAVAQQNCGGAADMSAWLTTEYGEVIVGEGEAQSNVILAMWGNAETGPWTITARLSDGRLCVMASGGGFRVPVTRPPGTDG